MAQDSGESTQRREQVMDTALGTFATFGFRKTSMDSVAQAADISRQGLYFLFASKNELFVETMRHAMDKAMASVRAVLADESVSLADRLVAALDEWLGRYLGTHIDKGLDALLEDNSAALDDLYDSCRATFLAALADAIGEPDGAEVSEVLHAAATGWKHRMRSREEFRTKLSMATRLVLR